MIRRCRAGRTLSAVLCLAALLPWTTHAERIAGYAFDGTADTQNPPTIMELGGNTNRHLEIGSSADYNADVPLVYAGNTSFDVTQSIQNRAANDGMDDFEFDGNEPWSVLLWIKGNTNSATTQIIVGQRRNPTGNGWYVGLNGSGHAAMFHQGQLQSDGRGPTGDTDLFDGGWHYLVAVNDPAADADGEMRLYVDSSTNVHVHGKVQQMVPTLYDTSEFAVGTGRDSGGNFQAFDGLVDEVALFDHVLSTNEVEFFRTHSIATSIGTSFTEVTVEDVRALEFQSEAGLTYRLERGTDLGPPGDFTPTGALLEGNGALMLMYDNLGFSTQLFYRIISSLE